MRAGSSSDQAGTVEYCQIGRSGERGRGGVTRVNQRLTSVIGNRLQPGGCGPGCSARRPDERGGDLRVNSRTSSQGPRRSLADVGVMC